MLQNLRNMSEDKKRQFSQEAYDLGFKYERVYHGCSQAAFGALQELLGISSEEAFKAASGLGGGIGLCAEGTCGALSGGAMFLSYLYGREREHIDDPNGMRFIAYTLCKNLYDKFIEEYGTCICKEIQKIKTGGIWFRPYIPEEFAEAVKLGAHDRLCPEVVGKATQWTAQIILEKEAG